MKKKLFVIGLALSLLFSGLLVAVESGASGMIDERGSEKNIETMEEDGAFFNVTITDYPEEAEKGDVVEIEYNVTNTGNANGTQDIVLFVKDEEVNRTENLTLEPGEEWNTTVTYDTADIEIEDIETSQITIKNDVSIVLESNDDVYRVEMTVSSEVTTEVPGFISTQLLLGVIFAMAIYYKKKQ